LNLQSAGTGEMTEVLRHLQAQADAARETGNSDLLRSTQERLRDVRLHYLTKKRAELHDEERTLKEKWSALRENATAPEELVQKVATAVGELTAEERERLATAKRPGDLGPELSSRLSPALEMLREFDGKH